ncbi:MAG: hypothetical protein V1835_03060 [Candidatus Micrarchaeota archaeon]
MKGKEGGCGEHWYLDGIMMLIGLGYLVGMDGWRLFPGFSMSAYLPAWGVLFIFLGLKMYMMKHG